MGGESLGARCLGRTLGVKRANLWGGLWGVLLVVGFPGLRACTRRLSGVENGDRLRVLEVPVPVLDGADAESRVAGNRERHLDDSEPVPVPSSYPFSYTL